MKRRIAVGLMALSIAACGMAEQNPAQPPSSPQAGMPPQGGGMRPDGRRPEGRGFEMRFAGPDEAFRILPPGPWWKDAELAKRIELTPDQQKRIEDSFLQSKIELIHLHAGLEEQELLLAPMLDANPIDQGRVLAQVSKVADMRANLEKANAKMLLQIRGVLSQAQWTKLQQERSSMHHHMYMHMPEGMHSWNRSTPDIESLRERIRALPQTGTQPLQ